MCLSEHCRAVSASMHHAWIKRAFIMLTAAEGAMSCVSPIEGPVRQPLWPQMSSSESSTHLHGTFHTLSSYTPLQHMSARQESPLAATGCASDLHMTYHEKMHDV